MTQPEVCSSNVIGRELLARVHCYRLPSNAQKGNSLSFDKIFGAFRSQTKTELFKHKLKFTIRLDGESVQLLRKKRERERVNSSE